MPSFISPATSIYCLINFGIWSPHEPPAASAPFRRHCALGQSV